MTVSLRAAGRRAARVHPGAAATRGHVAKSGAVRTNPTSEEILAEEMRYMSAIRAAREVLEQTA